MSRGGRTLKKRTQGELFLRNPWVPRFLTVLRAVQNDCYDYRFIRPSNFTARDDSSA